MKNCVGAWIFGVKTNKKADRRMESIREFIDELITAGAYKIVLSGAGKGGEFRRIALNLADGEYFAEKLTEKQAFHERIPVSGAAGRIEALFADFSQINAWNEQYEFTAKLTKKGRLLSGRHAVAAPPKKTGREREKSYLLAKNRVVPPLVDMGVMTAGGEIVRSMSDKFRQINRFLEFIDELIPDEAFNDVRPVNIVDFGCGKSYLTFIVYYYFTFVRKKRVSMTGLDLKADVIDFCKGLAEKYCYSELNFYCGDIADFASISSEPIDVVISLHACDTATDLALYNAVRFGAKYVISVPCCQHELNKTADFSALPLFSDGILRERASALLTDAIRKNLLICCGYSARVMEFVDLSHTPKNLMLRAKKAHISEKERSAALIEVEKTLAALKTEQTLHRLLIENGFVKSRPRSD